MRVWTLTFVAAVAFLVGLATIPISEVISDQLEAGGDHHCVANRVCVGMKAEVALKPYLTEGAFGGLIGVYCGFSRPGEVAGYFVNLASVIERGCMQEKYVASFSDGRQLTSLWVDNGIIVKIDQGPRHGLDL